MAYLMTDMAAGSDAALRMQQNIAAAPNVQQMQANVMQEQQLKLEQQRINNQQAQANIEKTKLSNIAFNMGLEKTKDTTKALQDLMQSPEWKKAETENDESQMNRLVARMHLKTNDPEGYTKAMASAEMFDLRKAQADAKKADNLREQIGVVSSILNNTPEDQVNETFEKLPDDFKKAVTDKVGEAWKTMTPKQKQDVVDQLMRSGNQKLQEQRMLLQAQAKKYHDDMELEKKRYENEVKLQLKQMGLQSKQEKIMKEDRAWKTVSSELDNLRRDPDKVKARERLDLEVEEAEKKAKETTTLGGLTAYVPEGGDKDARFYSKQRYDDWMKAVIKRDKALSKQYDEEQSLIETLPDSMATIRSNMLERIKRQRMTLTLEEPKGRSASGTITPVPSPGSKSGLITPVPSPVPSNKPAQEVRTITQADVAETAKNSGKTIEQVKAAALAKGWKIKD